MVADPKRMAVVAADLVAHFEKRAQPNASVWPMARSSFLQQFKRFAFDGVGGFHRQRALSALLQRGADGR